MQYLANISNDEFTLNLQSDDSKYIIHFNNEILNAEFIKKTGTNSLIFKINSKYFEVDYSKNNSDYSIFFNGNSYTCKVEDERTLMLKKFSKKKVKSNYDNEIKSSMPGLITLIEVEPGQTVKKGQGLLIIEAMKMENEIKAPYEAKIKEILVKQKQTVEVGQTLIVLDN